MNLKLKLTITAGMFLLVLAVYSQDVSNVDDAFKSAREQVFLGERQAGIQTLQAILLKSPRYDDVRIFLGRTYAWIGQRDSARLQLQIVLARTPDHEDAIGALIDVEMWDDRYTAALAEVSRALLYYPDSPDFLFKKASVLNTLDRSNEALVTLEELLMLHPGHEQAINLKENIRANNLKYTAGIFYGLDIFSRTFAPAHYSGFQLARSNSWGSSILRLNYASRFSIQGWQPEIDLYPKITDGVYAYLNYGYSSSDLFARHRLGGELYSKLPGSLEASAGLRYLYFGSTSKVLIYTGSLGWYFKDYWISYRPYITPDKAGTSFSSTLLLRRYFEDANNYLGFSAGFGFSPDEGRIQNGAGFSTDGIFILKSQNLGIAWQKTISHNFSLSVTYSLIHQELSFDLSEYVWMHSSLFGIRKKF